MRYTFEITDPIIENAHVFANEAMRADNFAEFKTALINLNLVVRGGKLGTVGFRNKEEAVYRDGSVLWVAPSPDSIESLLEEAWKKSLEFDSEPKRAGYLLHALYAIHPFTNGNGRTGRSLYYSSCLEDTDFKKEVWAETDYSPVFSSVGFTQNLIENALRNKLVDITHLPNAKSLILKGCEFDEPDYWRYARWGREMPKEYQMLLQEKDGDCFRQRHEAISLRFPHIALLDFALKHGLIKRNDLNIDVEGTLRVNIHPEKFMGMSDRGVEVMRVLKESKHEFVRAFLQDGLGIIKDAVQGPNIAKRIIAAGKGGTNSDPPSRA